MQFLIADSFTDSLGRLTGDEQKQVKTTAFDLQINLANPGLHVRKHDRAKGKSFWSVCGQRHSSDRPQQRACCCAMSTAPTRPTNG